MATKANLITAVNTFLSSVISITKHRNSMLEVINNVYPTVVYDTNSTNTIFTKADDDFIYDIKTAKAGRLVNICGSFTNDTESAISNQKLVDITNTEYRTDALVVNHRIPAISESGLIIFLSLVGNSIEIVGTAPKDVKFFFNGNYTVKD